MRRGRLGGRLEAYIARHRLYALATGLQRRSPRCHLAAALLADLREHRRRWSHR
jgi:hypothetical protein